MKKSALWLLVNRGSGRILHHHYNMEDGKSVIPVLRDKHPARAQADIN